MKPALTCTEWGTVSERLAAATREVAEIANLLDQRVHTECACDEAKRIEMELCVLESRLRGLRSESDWRVKMRTRTGAREMSALGSGR
jgi:hypothetical protein